MALPLAASSGAIQTNKKRKDFCATQQPFPGFPCSIKSKTAPGFEKYLSLLP